MLSRRIATTRRSAVLSPLPLCSASEARHPGSRMARPNRLPMDAAAFLHAATGPSATRRLPTMDAPVRHPATSPGSLPFGTRNASALLSMTDPVSQLLQPQCSYVNRASLPCPPWRPASAHDFSVRFTGTACSHKERKGREFEMKWGVGAEAGKASCMGWTAAPSCGSAMGLPFNLARGGLLPAS